MTELNDSVENKYHPAFPEPVGDMGYPGSRQFLGLTKREYFAAMALSGLLSNPHPDILHAKFSLAEFAVTNADDLLKQLEQ